MKHYQNTMRDIITLKSIEGYRTKINFEDTLSKVITNTFGRIGEEEIKEIDYSCARKVYDSLFEVFPSLTTGEYDLNIYGYPSYYQTIREERGTKKTRKLIAFLHKLGCDTTCAAFQNWLFKWTSQFYSQPLEYRICWDIRSFDKLGCIPNVDDNYSGGSCFNPKGAYKEAPVVLATGVGGRIHTFIIFLSKINYPDEISARCYGFVTPDGFILTNGYYSDGILMDMRLFVRALEKATETSLTYTSVSLSRGVIYTNGDTVAVYPTARPMEIDGESVPRLIGDCVNRALNLIDEETGSSSVRCLGCLSRRGERAFCNSCLGNRIDCDSCGESVPEDDSIYCDDCGGLCHSCYSDNHNDCVVCGRTQHSDDCPWFDGDAYCMRCYERNFFTCNACGEEYSKDDKAMDASPAGGICNGCYENQLYENQLNEETNDDDQE